MNREARLARAFYTRDPEREWERLRRGALNTLEFSTTLEHLDRYLPRRGTVLDAGGGPGRYTIETAKRGCDVVLLDLTPASLDMARRKIRAARVQSRVREVVEGSIVDLSRFGDSSFDAVLCLGGPLSHVHPERDRRKALAELARVAKPGAPILVSVFGRFAVLACGVAEWHREYEDAREFERLWRWGDDYRWCGGHFAHYFTAEEFRSLFPRNVECVEMVGLDGLASAVRKPFGELPKKSPRAYRNWLRAHAALRTHPTVVDASAHMLFVGRRRRRP